MEFPLDIFKETTLVYKTVLLRQFENLLLEVHDER